MMMLQPAMLDGQGKKALERMRGRLVFCIFMMATLYMLLCGRLMDLGVSSVYHEQDTAATSNSLDATASLIQRADIVDRNGVLLASNLTTQSLYANPRVMIDKEDAIKKLSRTFPDLSPAFLRERFSARKNFVWLKRNLTPKEEMAVNNLGIPGLDFQAEQRRIYPQGDLFAHVLGYVGMDGHGLSGMEKTYDDQMLSDNKPVALTLDVRVQNSLKAELEQTIRKFRAIGASALVMDVNNGQILGLISLPDFNPNRFTKGDANGMFNRALSGVYEMGSTMKTINMAMALDSGRVHMGDSYDATNPIKIGRYQINDFHAQKRVLSVPEVFMYSSNIGSAKMALDVGAEAQQKFFKKAGLLKPIAIELPEKPHPLYPKQWTKTSAMTISFGHGIAVSPLHLISVISGLVNGGMMHQPTIIKHDEPLDSTRLVKARTSDSIRRLLRLVVTNGSGKNANVAGYLVGGKTGTAEKLGDGHYSKDARLSSFIGVFPINKPRYAVLVMVDEPKGLAESGGYATGGIVAAPAAGRIITQIAPMLGVEPVDENAPGVREAIRIDYEVKERKLASAQ
jgi:cell division protein FtsI (penicillin-binding protein 3)